MYFNGLSLDLFNHHEWSYFNDIRSVQRFFKDQSRKRNIEAILYKVDFQTELPVFRIVGSSGIGKSRLVFESFNDPEYIQEVVYANNPDPVTPRAIKALGDGPWRRAILIVDECPQEKHVNISKQVSRYRNKLALITIYPHDQTLLPSPTNYIDISKLDDENTLKIVQDANPELPDELAALLVTHCFGFPRFADLLAKAISKQAELYSPDVLRTAGFEWAAMKVISGGLNENDPYVIETKRVLQVLSLVRNLGWDDDLMVEGKTFYQLFGFGKNWHEVRNIIETQCSRGLVKKVGRKRYLTPDSVVIYLATEWWKNADFNDLERILAKLIELELIPVFDSFFERLKILAKVDQALAFARHILGDQGFFASARELRSDIGSRVFSYLSTLNRKAALDALERILAVASPREIQQIDTGRLEIVSALRRMVAFPDSFDRAAAVLMRLAENPPDDYRNEAAEAWSNLFQPTGSGITLSLSTRQPLIEQALESGSRFKCEMGLKAISKMITISWSGDVFTRRPYEEAPPGDWEPTGPDFLHAARWGVNKLWSVADGQDPDLSRRALEILRDKADTLIRLGLIEDGITILERLMDEEKPPSEELMRIVEIINRFGAKGFPQPLQSRLDQLVDRARGEDFEGRLRRFTATFVMVEPKDVEKTGEYEERELNQLAQEACAGPDKLRPHLEWLSGPEAKRAGPFGNALGQADNDGIWLEPILEAIRTVQVGNPALLGGYLRALREVNRDKVENVLDRVAGDEVMRRHLVDLSWHVGASERTIERLLLGLREEWIPWTDLNALRYGGWLRDLDDKVLLDFLADVFDMYPDSVWTILYLIDMAVHLNRQLISALADLIESVVTSEKLLGEEVRLSPNDWYHWSNLTLGLLEIKPVAKNTIFVFLRRALTEREVYRVDEYMRKVIARLLEIDADQTWKVVGDVLIARLSSYILTRSIFQGRRHLDEPMPQNLIHLVPPAILWAWCSKNQPDGPVALARIISFPMQDQLDEVVQELVRRYWNRDDIQSALHANFYTESWTGPRSAHYRKKLSFVQKWHEAAVKQNERRVAKWTEGLIIDLEADIKSAIEQEEERALR
ncbi:MAG: hypothetical protein KJ621_16220 [Proteobacteria bacterium]|nr:hypothetical protein [Pseudomonadota bacterium]